MQDGNRGEAFERYRALLFSIAYRMTGSASDAEDLVQETYLRYQASANQDIVSLRSFIGPDRLCKTTAHASSWNRSASDSFCSVFLPPARPGTWRH